MHTVITFMSKPLRCGWALRHAFRCPLYSLTLASSIWVFLKLVSPKLKDDAEVLVKKKKQRKKAWQNDFSKAKEDLRAEREGTKWSQNSQATVMLADRDKRRCEKLAQGWENSRWRKCAPCIITCLIAALQFRWGVAHMQKPIFCSLGSSEVQKRNNSTEM